MNHKITLKFQTVQEANFDAREENLNLKSQKLNIYIHTHIDFIYIYICVCMYIDRYR